MIAINLVTRGLLFAAVALHLAGCGGGGDGGGNPPPAVTAPTNLSYPSPTVAGLNVMLAALSPTVTGSVASYEVSPALPAGLSLSTSNGQITGTPTATSAATDYLVTARNSAGSATFSVRLQVLAPPAALSYAGPVILARNAAIAPLAPTVTGTVDSFSVTPGLPAGLVLSTTTGIVSGSPTALSAAINYTIRARNVAGEATYVLRIAVEDGRSTVDQPDLATSPYQVHFIYAMPTGGTDNRRDVNGTLDTSRLAANAWMTSISSGGQRVRFDERLDGSIDVTFFQLANNDAFYASKGNLALNDMAAEIAASPLYNPNKIYLIFYEGGNSLTCGSGMNPGHFSAAYLNGTPPGFTPCANNTFASAPTATAAGYREWLIIHEVVHNLGFVNACSSHYSNYNPGHTGDDPSDLMWGVVSAGDTRNWLPTSLDPGNDDYYGANVPAGCPRNLFNSAFLEPSHGSQLPVGF